MGMQVTYESLAGETGFYLGYNRAYTSFTTNQLLDVNLVLVKGMRMWYFPLWDGKLYRWSFLRKTGQISLLENVVQYDLPTDFLGFVTDTINCKRNAKRSELIRRSEETLLAQHAQAWVTGEPKYFAVRSKAPDETGLADQEILIYPVPDLAVDVTFRYMFLPADLSTTNQTPLGGAIHGETILAACLAAAEQKIEDTAGLHNARFQQLLAASIAADMDMAR